MNILTTSSDTDSDLNYNLQSNSAEHTLSSEEVQCQWQKSKVLCFLAFYTELLGWNESCRKMSGCQREEWEYSFLQNALNIIGLTKYLAIYNSDFINHCRSEFFFYIMGY